MLGGERIETHAPDLPILQLSFALDGVLNQYFISCEREMIMYLRVHIYNIWYSHSAPHGHYVCQ